MRRSRWTALAGCLLTEAIGGLFYAFALYSESLKASFNLSQTQVDSIGFASNLGGNFGPHMGLLYDATGPTLVLFVAAALSAVGWFPLWAAVTFPAWSGTPFGVLVLLGVLQGHAQMTSDMATIPTAAHNFPNHRGLVLGLCKSLVGLSGSLASCVYVGVFKPIGDDSSSGGAPGDDCDSGSSSSTNEAYVDHFLLFVAIWSVAFTLFAALFLRRVHEESTPEGDDAATADEDAEAGDYAKTNIWRAYAGMVVLAAILLAAALAEKADEATMQRGAKVGLMCAAFAVFCALVVFVGTRSDDGGDEGEWLLDDDDEGKLPAPVQSARSATPDVSASPGSSRGRRPAPPGAEDTGDVDHILHHFTLWEALCTANFWIHFMCCVWGAGSGLVIINNLGQITRALGMEKGAEAPYVSMISVFNCLGRLVFGFGSDIALRRWGVPRVWAYVVGLAMMAAAHFLLLLNTQGALAPAVIVAGLAYGSFNCLNPAIASEIFGLTHMGSLYGTISMSLAVGSFCLATQLAGKVYDHHKPDCGDCKGGECYRLTFIICAIGTCGAVLLGIVYAIRSRARYAALYPRDVATDDEGGAKRAPADR